METPLQSALAKLMWVLAQSMASGEELVYRRKTGSDFDPAGQQTTTVFEEVAVRGVVKVDRRDGFAPAASRVSAIVPDRCLNGTPVIGDQVVRQGRTYQVTAVEPVYLGVAHRLTVEEM